MSFDPAMDRHEIHGTKCRYYERTKRITLRDEIIREKKRYHRILSPLGEEEQTRRDINLAEIDLPV